MSQLLKALKNLETRGAPFAPSEAAPPPPPAAAEPAAAPVAASTVKPRPAERVRPRRAESSRKAASSTTKLETLAATQPQPPLFPAIDKEKPAPQQSVAASRETYALAPAVVVNQAALDAGTALVQEMASATCEIAGFVDSPQVVSETFLPAAKSSPLPTAPALPHSPTLFEHRIRETLMHPARSRAFADLTERLRQDFRGSSERSLLFTGIGPASRGDEMLGHVAALFADQGEKILLVDADFERAGLTAGFSAGTLSGLQNVIVSPDAWRDHLLATSFPQITFLPTGRGNVRPEAAAATLARLIPEWESEFPLVLIDGGQSSGSIVSSLARFCDSTYLVIRLGATDAKEAQLALRTFRSAGARVMGCVATMDSV